MKYSPLPPASFRCALRLTPLPLATLRLHQAGSGLYLKYVSLFQVSPFSSRALPGTQQGYSLRWAGSCGLKLLPSFVFNCLLQMAGYSAHW